MHDNSVMSVPGSCVSGENISSPLTTAPVMT